MTVQNPLLSKLRGAAALRTKPASSALEFLTGSWDRPVGLFVQQAQPSPAPTKIPTRRQGHGKARTIYLDEQAENDLHFLLDEIQREYGQSSRSETVRRALRAARLAAERGRPWTH